MATAFPGGLDSFTNPAPTDTLDSVSVPHASQHDNLNDAVAALEAKVGVNGSAVTSSLDYLVAHPASSGPGAGPYLMRKASQCMTVDPAAICASGSSQSMSTGVIYFAMFTAGASFTSTQVRYSLNGAAALSNAGTSIGLYSMDASDNGTLLASVSSTSLFTTVGLQTATWAVSAAITAGSRYAVGFLNVVNSGNPGLVSTIAPLANFNAEMLMVPRYYGSRTGQAAQGSFTVAQLTAAGLPQIFAVIL